MGAFRNKLKSIVEDNTTKGGRIFDILIQFFIVTSVAAVCVETIPDLSENTRDILRGFEVFTIAVFSVEYVLRIIVADKKLKYIFSFYGIIDLLAILPFYLSLGIDLRSLRILRLFRIFRMIKVVRYSQALRRLQLALKLAGAELTVFAVAIVLLFILAGLGIHAFENAAQPEVFTSFFSSVWWAIVSLTTVGYGDMVPITTGGKILSSFMLVLGVGLVAVPTGIISSALTKVKDEDLNDQDSDR